MHPERASTIGPVPAGDRSTIVAAMVDAVLVAAVAWVCNRLWGGHAGTSALVGGLLGLGNLVAMSWLVGRMMRYAGDSLGLHVALFGAKFITLIGVISGVVMVLDPDVGPFLTGFSTSLPVVTVLCISRFRQT